MFSSAHTRTRSQHVLDAAGSPSVFSSHSRPAARPRTRSPRSTRFSSHTPTRLRSEAGVTQNSTDKMRPQHEHEHATRPFCVASSLLITLSAPPPFWACSSSLRQSGADTPPSFITVTGYFLHPAKNLGVIVVEAPKTMRNVLPLFPGFGGNSR